MPDSALPENLRGRKHEDWIYPLNKISRGLTAFKWRMPPKLLVGYNVRRWDTGERGDDSSLEYPFGQKWVWWWHRIPVSGAVKKYGPNAIQKILGQWRFSFHITYPLGFHMTIKLWKKKNPCISHFLKQGKKALGGTK